MYNSNVKETVNVWDFLSQNLTAQQYDNLDKILCVSKKRVGQLKKRPWIGNLSDCIRIAAAAGICPHLLVSEYQFGWNCITVGEMEFLRKNKGNELCFAMSPPIGKPAWVSLELAKHRGYTILFQFKKD